MKSRWIKTIQHRIEYAAVLGLLLPVQLLSITTVLKIADKLGSFAFHVIRIRRRVAEENLRVAFPKKSDQEIRNIVHRLYKNLARSGLELIYQGRESKAHMLERCQVVGIEHLESALAHGKGVLLLSGHFGNWELLFATLAKRGYPVSAVAREQSNKQTNEVINGLREKGGLHVIPLGISIRGVIRDLRENKCIVLVADQDAGRDGVFVNFLGRPSSTPIGPAELTLKFGAPIVFTYAVRGRGARHVMHVEPFDLPRGGTHEETVRLVLQQYAERLESCIRRYPDHWFWVHKRWKTKPPE